MSGTMTDDVRIWHTEECEDDYPGQRFQLLQDELLCDLKSPYQSIKVFKHKMFGTVLALDGCVQATTYDEFLYQEMLTYLPLCSVLEPKKVLVVGGGDGGIVRELLKDSRVEDITLVDIDEQVLQVCKEYIPSMGKYLEHDKVSVIIGDAQEYIKYCSDKFDVVILDVTDYAICEEKDNQLLNKDFYAQLKNIMNDGGVVSYQAFSPYQNNNGLRIEIENMKGATDMIGYGFVPVPSFPNGMIAILFGRITKELGKNYESLNAPVYRISAAMAKEMGLRCYYDEYHVSSCTLPLEFKVWFEETAGL
jgi:spermidine synthase